MQRKYFLRANTSAGLVNLTDSNMTGIENLYVLKGDSKFLKSRILQNTAKYLEERKIDTECAVSPFEISNLDAVFLRELKTAVIDCDCLGNCETGNITDTNEFIKGSKVAKYQKHQRELSAKSLEALSGMYSAYREAKTIHDEWEKLYIENIDFDRLNAFEEKTITSLIAEKSKYGIGRVYKRFFGASTPDGSVNYIENLTIPIKNRYFIKGRPGTGKSTFMKKILRKLQDFDYDCEIYYCSFDKNSLDMVLIPELSVCVFDSTAPHELFPSRDEDKILDFYTEAGLSGVDERLKNELSEIQKRYSFRITEGISKLRLASGYMKEIECYNESASDLELTDKATDRLVRKILS